MTQSNLQVQCDPYQITHDIFHRTRTNNPKIYVEPQKTQNCQSNSEEQKPSRRHNSPRPHAISQSHIKCVTGTKTDIHTHGTGQRTQKQTQTPTVN